MSNTTNRLKTNQLCKVDKDIENKDIKRKIKNIPKSEKCVKPESVWERLSRVKKSSSNDLSDESNSKIHPELPPKANPRVLATSTQSSNKRVYEKRPVTRSMKSPRTIFFPELATERVVYLREPINPNQENVNNIHTGIQICVEESKLLNRKMAINTNNCVGRSRFVQPLMTYECLDEHMEKEFSQGSTDDFEMAPLMPVPTRDSMSFSAKITSNFRNILEQNHKSMQPEEINVIKNVVKTDERHRQLQENDRQLFKDILKTQLREILRQETVVQTALNHLDSASDSARTTISSDTATNTETQNTKVLGVESIEMDVPNNNKPRVDVIFKNVPTLEKEIIILKALGEKLEATLRRASAVEDVANVHQRTTATSTSSLQVQRILLQAYLASLPQCAVSQANVFGVMVCSAAVKEFRIVNKTIHELKQEATKHFYIPSSDKTHLKRTTFKKLKQNPEMLMKHIKAKSSLVPFNVLDHDPVFFNNYIFNSSTSSARPAKIETESKMEDDSLSSSDDLVNSEITNSKSMSCRPYQQNEDKEPLSIEEIHLPEPSMNTQKKLDSKKLRHSSNSVLMSALKHMDGAGSANGMLGKEGKDDGGLCQKDPFENARLTESNRDEETRDKNRPNTMQPKTRIQLKNEERMGKNILFEAPIRGEHRRRIGKGHTPMPMHKYFDPKNNLLRTVIIGTVQMSMFLLLVMAITYPDVRC